MELSQKFVEGGLNGEHFADYFQNVIYFNDASGGSIQQYSNGYFYIKCMYQDFVQNQTKNIFLFNGEKKIYKQIIRITGQNNGLFQWGPFYLNGGNYYGFYFQVDLGQFSIGYSNGDQNAPNRKIVAQQNFNIDTMLAEKNKNGFVLDVSKPNEYYIIFDFMTIIYGVVFDGKMYDFHKVQLPQDGFSLQFKYYNLPMTQYCLGKSDNANPALRDCDLYTGNGFVKNFAGSSTEIMNEFKYILLPQAEKTVASGADFVPLIVIRQRQIATIALMRKFVLEQIEIKASSACVVQIRYFNDVSLAFLSLNSNDWIGNNTDSTYQFIVASTTIVQEDDIDPENLSTIMFQTNISDAGTYTYPFFDNQLDNQPYPLNGYSLDDTNSYIAISVQQQTGGNQTFSILCQCKEIY